MTQPIKYRKKPIIIEAIQLEDNPPSFVDALEWINKHGGKAAVDTSTSAPFITIETLNGQQPAKAGDAIIHGYGNEFYPCPKAVFEATYDRIVERRR
jgi:hypothetical protein